jgi:Bacteriophage Sf6, terminase small subunit-like
LNCDIELQSNFFVLANQTRHGSYRWPQWNEGRVPPSIDDASVAPILLPYFQEIIDIADHATPETVNVARLRVDSRKFAVARLAPEEVRRPDKPRCPWRCSIPTGHSHPSQWRGRC